MPEIRPFADGDWYDQGGLEPRQSPLTVEHLTLRDELDRMRGEADSLWRPLRWLFNRKLDRLEAILDETRDAALRRYFQS